MYSISEEIGEELKTCFCFVLPFECQILQRFSLKNGEVKILFDS